MVALGRDVLDQLRSAADSGDLEREVLALPHLLADPSLLAPSLVITNVGRVQFSA